MRISDSTTQARPTSGESGFSLLEMVVALSLLAVGLLGLAQTFYVGVSIVGTSSAQLIAREKAREAIESVHTARDTKVITWAMIRNVTAPTSGCTGTTGIVAGPGGGRFVQAPTGAMLAAGPDGLVNTTDDLGDEVLPGPDGRLYTADDVKLVGFTRQITICDVQDNANLRRITVVIGFPGSGAIGSRSRTYTLTTFISSYS